MARPKEVIEAVAYKLQQSPNFPDETNFVGYEPDIDSEPIKLPLVEVSADSMVNISEANSDFVGFRTDNDGNDIGRIYEALWTISLDVSVWTAHGSKFSPRAMSDAVRDELFDHTTSGPAQPLRNPDGTPIYEVWDFTLDEAQRTDELGRSPTLRRWQQSVTVSASEEYLTDSSEPPISATGDLRLEYDDSNNSFEEVYDLQ